MTAEGRGGRRRGALEWTRARALLRAGWARGRTASDPAALAAAGDRYEEAGRARSALAAMGARPSRAVGALFPIASWISRRLHALRRGAAP